MYGNELGQEIARRRNLGVLIFDRDAVVLHCSREANRQLAESGLRLSGDKLIANSNQVTQRIAKAVTGCFIERIRRDTLLVLGDDPVSSVLLSIHFSEYGEDGEEIVVGLIRSPGTTEWDEDGQRIMDAFGLTPREAELSLHLSRGNDLSEFAANHFLTINTVKTHLRQLFKKMHVNKQLQVAVVVLAALR